jgi:hypothetical protein
MNLRDLLVANSMQWLNVKSITHMFRASCDLGNPFVNSTPFDEWNLQIQSH